MQVLAKVKVILNFQVICTGLPITLRIAKFNKAHFQHCQATIHSTLHVVVLHFTAKKWPAKLQIYFTLTFH
jgi:hypothetical protein